MKASSSLAAALGCALLFCAVTLPLLSLVGLGKDEAWHAETALSELSGSGMPPSTWPQWPLMRDYYNGPLKSYLLMGVFRAAGSSPLVLRRTTTAVGAGCVFFLVLLTARLHGLSAALALGVFCATDPALVLGAAFDTGPAILSLLLKLAAFWLAVGWRQEGGAARLFGAGLLLGLGLWDKAQFVWLLGAVFLTLYWFRRALPRPSRREAAAAAGGLLLGSSVFLVFNLIDILQTFLKPDSVRPMREHLAGLSGYSSGAWRSLVGALGGGGQYSLVTGDLFSAHERRLWVLALLLAGLLAYLWRRRRSAPLAWAWLSLTGLTFAAAVLSPVPLKWHHLYLVYPLPHLAACAAWAAALPSSGRRAGLVWAAAVLLLSAALAEHGRLWLRFRASAEEHGGSAHFSASLGTLWPALQKRLSDRPLPLFLEDGFQSRLAVLSGGALRYTLVQVGRPDGQSALTRTPESWLLLRTGPRTLLEQDFESAMRDRGLEFERELAVSRKDGGLWAVLYAVRSPAARDAAAAAAWLALVEKASPARAAEAIARQGPRMERLLDAAGRKRLLAVERRSAQREQRQGRCSLAELKKLLASDPGDPSLWMDLGGCQLESGRRAEALLSLHEAQRHGAAPRRLALLFQQAQAYEPALSLLRGLALAAPKDASLLTDLGVCLYLAGRKAEARASLEEALRLDPGSRPAAASLEALR